jgi:hypothetical protein
LTIRNFDAKSLGDGIASITCRTLGLFVCHTTCLPYSPLAILAARTKYGLCIN